MYKNEAHINNYIMVIVFTINQCIQGMDLSCECSVISYVLIKTKHNGNNKYYIHLKNLYFVVSDFDIYNSSKYCVTFLLNSM